MPTASQQNVGNVPMPGTAKSLNYPLWEKTLPGAPKQAKQARAMVLDKYSPDYLGKHPPPYSTSVYVEQNKFQGRHPTEKLVNTLDPVTLKRVMGPDDYKLQSGGTIKHPPAHLGGTAVASIPFTKAETTGDWNMSTVQDYKDFAKAQAEFSKKAQTATMKQTTKLLKTYSNPTEREAQRMETMRAAKKEELEHRGVLESAYGADTAAELIRLGGTQKRSDGSSRPRRAKKPSKADMQALRELDDFEPPAAPLPHSKSTAVSEYDVEETT
mmetsp:Transcript_11614/g.20954  ORF Transcript_11614/g.20954 Transcript_11614/m.20954 type:complete len:270 (-) Transcript_11614:141-950(-)